MFWNKKVYKNEEKGLANGVCYGLAKGLNLNKKAEKAVRYFLRFVFIAFGLALIGIVIYGILNRIMIDYNKENDVERENLRTNPYLNYSIFSILIVIWIIGGIASSGPTGGPGVASGAVRNYLDNRLKNPASLDIIASSDVKKTDEGNYAQKVKYRAENSFGGNVIETKIFIMKKTDGCNSSYKVKYIR